MAVSVRPMTTTEFADWSEHAIVQYAADICSALGVPPEGALVRTREMFARMLPDGLASESSWLLVVIDDAGASIGTLWLGRHPELPHAAFVYDIEIAESMRGQGFGRAAMLLAEDVMRDAGYAELHLNVFGFNDTARGLYDSLGYQVVSTTMSKPIMASVN